LSNRCADLVSGFNETRSHIGLFQARGAPGGVNPPGRYAVGKFSLFGKILPRLAGPQGPIFVSNGPGFREDGPPRPRAARFQRKMGAYGDFSGLCDPLDPKMLQKYYKKMTKMLQNCYKNIIKKVLQNCYKKNITKIL
jgi:hypothetical protein